MQNRIAVIGLVLLVGGCRVIEPSPPPEAPRINSFLASKTRVTAGESVTLTYSTTGATKVQVTDDLGNDVTLTGEALEGTATVAPTRSSFYVLRATGAGGRDTAFVQIAVNETLKDLFLIAVPASINSGDEASLLWGAPGASAVTLTTGAGMPVALTGTTGSVSVTPATTERYTLTAQGAPNTPPLTAITEVQVRPVLSSAALNAMDGIEAGKTLTFTWRSAGAARIVVSEATFGQLTTVTEPSSVINGTFDYVLPAKLPNNVDVGEGTPLRFTISAVAGDVTVSKTLERVVGLRPSIDFFDAPANVSVGARFTVAWKTLNATEVSITANGLPLFRSLPGNQARVDQGSLSLPAPSTMTTYTLVASNDRGLTSERSFTVRPVPLPTITMYTLTGSFLAVGDPVTARWTTTNSTSITVRFENGPTLATITTPSQVTMGSSVLTLANSSRITIEAANAAGDFVSETRSVAFNGTPVAYVTPTPVLKGSAATLTWALAPANVLEVVGLPTPAPAAVPSSPNFVDLNTVATAQTLFFNDPVDGSEKLPSFPGFNFPMLGKVQNELWVSANGFIAFAKPAVLSTNADLAASGNTSPSMLAPLWDNLNLAATSKVLFAVQTMPNNERALIVQWNKAQFASDPASELTFEAQLYETGQVSFIYKTLTATAAINSATIGVKDTDFPAAQVYAFNSATIVPVADLELDYFTGGPAGGSVPLTAGASRNIGFVGRLATGRLNASAEVRSFGPGDVIINELMPFPAGGVTAGQWVEFKNTTSGTLNLDGLLVDTLGSNPDGGGFLFPPNSLLDAGALMLIGQSTVAADNGGAPVQLAATDIPMATLDRVRLTVAGGTINTFSWDAGTPGTSLQVAGDVLVASGSTFACPRTQTFGSLGAIGTPGAPNESCAPYVITPIPGRFTIAPASATVITASSSDDGYVAATLPQPFTYFGAPTTTMSLSTNGFLTLGYTLTGSYLGNDTTPSTSAPNGVVAIFWDDLVRDTGKNAMWRETDRTIITWEGFRMIGTTPTTTQINVQVHLLDTGVIEFHYGNIATTETSQTTIDRVFGNSATLWLERADGVVAVPYAINKLNSITPNSGLRFTPRP